MTEREKVEQAIAVQESMRGKIPDGDVDIAIAALRKQLAELKPTPSPEQRKQATVLFAGLSGFAPMVERMDDEDVGQILSTYFAAITPAIRKYGGAIEKFIGDAVVAVFGLPQTRENDPENSVRAALEMQQALDVLNEKIAVDWGFRLGMRVGVNTGPVVARYLGGGQKGDYAVVGNTVSLAKRLEKMAPAGGVLVSHDTYRLVRGVFDVLEHEPLRVDAVNRSVNTYLVQQAKPRAFHMLTRGVAGIETRMIGRGAEMLMLQNCFLDSTEDAAAHIVTIVGDTGVGKSRLLYEFEKWIELRPEDIWYFKGRATPETETMPYGLMRRMLAHRFDILESDGAVEVREKFRAGMAVALTSDQADVVGQMLGLDFSDSEEVQVRLGSESFGKVATTYLTTYLATLTREPTVILVEDIHWADDSSLDLMNHLVAAVHNSKLLVVCLARPPLFERRPSWGEGQEIHTQINLRPLSRRASRALVEEILQKAASVPTDLRDMIVDGAGGNPFYVEELIRMLIEDGIILPGENHWRIELDRLADVYIPPTLAGLLQARLDSLPAEEKMLLQRAAVVGRLFWDAALVELRAPEGDGFIEGDIASLLEAVRNRELVFHRERSAFAGAEEYIFTHTLLRDVIYETVLLRLRRVYHKQVARWLEVAAGKRIGEYLGLIAGHYELAGEGEKAVEYLLQAGDQARLAYACHEANGYYKRALPLLKGQGELDRAARTLMKLGLTYDLSFDFQRSRQAYEQGFALWRRVGVEQVEKLPSAPDPLRLATDNPTSLDPTMAEDTRSNTIIIELFSGLVEQRLDLGVIPDMAQSWEVLDGGKKYLFHLREDLLWSDGLPVTAGDFEYAWKRVLNPTNGNPLASLLDDIKGARTFRQGEVADPDSVGVEAMDDVTLVVELERPTGYFLQLLANTLTFPVPRHVAERFGEAWIEPEHIVTCGPFRLAAWKQGEQMTLMRNPRYPGLFQGNLECVELLLRDLEPADSLEMYEQDQLDVVDVTRFEGDRLRQKYAGEYRRLSQFVTQYLQFDVSRPPFDDVRVRKAFALVVNREALVKNIRPSGFPATGGFVPPGMPGHLPEIGLSPDLEQAHQLLAEAGFPNGQGFPPVEFLTRTDQADIGEYLQTRWKENLGISVMCEAVDWEVILGRLGEQVPHLLIMGWAADYPDPDDFLRARIDHIQQQSGWRNAGYDSLVMQAQHSLDQGERLKLYEEAERILMEEAPIVPIFHMSVRLLVKPWVTRFPTTGLRKWYFKDVIIKTL